RMLEYGLAALRKHHRYPTQVCLYVGEKPARMKTELRGPNLKYSFRLVDVRDLDGERLLRSGKVDDNIIALLTRIADQRKTCLLVVRAVSIRPPLFGRSSAYVATTLNVMRERENSTSWVRLTWWPADR
ncbi:MAG TPA: hypothetical protein VKB88_08675, partial [Bryobacteraceae bacterium]|nr:hypothetical protein [Bryobacteraceae bacterium]